MSRLTRYVAALVLVTAPAVAVGSPAAAAVEPLCTYDVTRVQAVNIQERNADEVYIELGDERFPRLAPCAWSRARRSPRPRSTTRRSRPASRSS
ncbi:hypothetical protein ACFQX7_21295 [Luedemannella flava]